jgi:DNA-cytosine methyltransferase
LSPVTADQESAGTNTVPFEAPTASAAASRMIWVVEDDAQTHDRQRVPGVLQECADIRVQLHRVANGSAELAASVSYESGSLPVVDPRLGRSGLALQMLEAVNPISGVVVAGTTYGNNRAFIRRARQLGCDIAVEVRRRSRWFTAACCTFPSEVTAADLLEDAPWVSAQVASPQTDRLVQFQLADLGLVFRDEPLRMFAFSPGSVVDAAGDLRLAVTSLISAPIHDVVGYVAWVRWIRTVNRRRTRRAIPTHQLTLFGELGPRRRFVSVASRPNIRLARRHDYRLPVATSSPPPLESGSMATRGLVELFAGAGGLGLGFLLAHRDSCRYRILCSAEVEPIYVQTLRRNHRYYSERLADLPKQVPEEVKPMDLRSRKTYGDISSLVQAAGGVDIVIGGPPCQGFSNANRNSWSADNPNNQLVEVFLRLVRRLQPRFALMENVQGILWTDRDKGASRLSVADHVVRSLERAGYLPFPKLLDAVWYGVPQHRARFFLLAVHRDTGYTRDDFGDWGPFPAPTHGPTCDYPYITVRQAIADLPEIGNAANDDVLPYSSLHYDALADNPYLTLMRHGAEPGIITDHITSRHADYVLDRYRRIPPGGNWQDIADMMTNYAGIGRTHSNIYRRLRYDEPSITMGHYRKSMLVHPTQDRGLSLREAARLQSIPDWFRLAGAADDRPGGLMHKQQQLANAVCPLVAKAIADYLLAL